MFDNLIRVFDLKLQTIEYFFILVDRKNMYSRLPQLMSSRDLNPNGFPISSIDCDFGLNQLEMLIIKTPKIKLKY